MITHNIILVHLIQLSQARILKMYYFPWCLLLLFGFSASEDISPNVTIKWEENTLSLKYRPTILIENKPFKIIVEPSSFNAGYTMKFKCNYLKTNTQFIDETLTQKNGRYVAEVAYASEKMTKTWNCSIKPQSSAHIYKNLEPLNFTAHVRLTKIPGEMRVNGRNINLNMTYISVSDYDAVGTYYYRDGELANISCHRLGNKTFNIHTIFYNVSDTPHKTGTDKEDVNVYLKLGHTHSPKYIDCVLKILMKPVNNTIRLMFKPITGQIDYPQFQINGLSLTPSKNDSDHNYVFIYEYYHGEDLTVESNLDLKSCAAVNFTNDIMLRQNVTELSFSISTHQFKYPEASVDCLVYGNNKNKLQKRISVKFIEDTMKFSPNITGIHWSDIIAKFYDNIDSRHNEGTIYASYNSNDNITLRCSNNINHFKWENNTEVTSTLLTNSSTENIYDSTKNEYYSSRTFQLSNVNETTLKCVPYDKNVTHETSKVVLIRGEKKTEQKTGKAKSPNKTNNNPNGLDGLDETTSNIIPPYYGKGEPKNDNFLYILIGVISIFTVIFIAILIACICKQKKLPKSDSDINYENLPAHNEGSMPIPSQWDTNRFKNMEEPYAKVIPKSQRTKVPEIYAEPISNMEDVCYATPYNANSESPYAEIIPESQRNENVPYNANSESPYAEIIPQSQRNENVPSASANVECYAQVVPKSLRNIAKNQVLPTNDIKNGEKLRPRADTDKHKYANVFNSEVYANVNSSGC